MENDKKRDYNQKERNPQEKRPGNYDAQTSSNPNTANTNADAHIGNNRNLKPGVNLDKDFKDTKRITNTDDFEEDDYQDYVEDGDLIPSSSGPQTYDPERHKKNTRNPDDLDDTDDSSNRDSGANRTPGL